MKPPVILSVCALLCVATANAQSPKAEAVDVEKADWVVVGESDAGTMAYSIVVDTDTAHSRTTRIRLLIRFRSDTAAGKGARERSTRMTTAVMEGRTSPEVAASEVVAEVDCERRRFRCNGRQTLYGDDGSVVESVVGDSEAPWKEVSKAPGWELVLADVCDTTD